MKFFVLLCSILFVSSTVWGITYNVSNSSQFNLALSKVKSGDVILVYKSINRYNSIIVTGTNFSIIGIKQPIIDTGSYSNGKIAISVINGYKIIISNFQVKNADKGIVINNCNKCKIYNCLVNYIGQEGIHLLNKSCSNYIISCIVKETGRVKPQYGEGLYVGSDYLKWDIYSSVCDYNIFSNNYIGPNVKAEMVDIKEGTTGNFFTHNIFNASGMSNLNGSSSFIDIKGNYNSISYNIGYQSNSQNLEYAFEIHHKLGWGYNNFVGYNTVYLNTANFIYDSKSNIILNNIIK